jgi:enamine deaminase RidA (YjgF/YER057c/UK114 family)
MTPSQQLQALGLTLPAPAAPVGSYVPATRIGSQALTSGQIPMVDGELLHAGIVGADISLSQAQACAQACVLNALAAVADVAGGLDRIERVVRVCVFVASTPDFTAQPQVANAASDLLAELFGAKGRHVRSAVGVASLPLNAPVELELMVEVTPG